MKKNNPLEEGFNNPWGFCRSMFGQEKRHLAQEKFIDLRDTLILVASGNRVGKTHGLFQKHHYECTYKPGLKDSNGNKITIWDKPKEWFKAPYLTLNCSYEYAVAEKVFALYRWAARNIDCMREGAGLIRKIDEQKRRVFYENNSIFCFGSTEECGKHLEGEAFHFISEDEVGYEKNLENLLRIVLTPRTMGVGGYIALVGTPKPDSHPLLERLWVKAKDEVKLAPEKRTIELIQVSMFDNPFLDKKEIEKKMEELKDTPHLQRMIVYGEFVPSSSRCLTPKQISNAIDDTLPNDPRDAFGMTTKNVPYMHGTQEKVEGHNYRSFWDLGMEHDWAVGITVDCTSIPFKVVNFTRVRRGIISGWEELMRLMAREYIRYGSVQHYDASGMAGGIIQEGLTRVGKDEFKIKGSWTKGLKIIGDKGKKKSGQIGKEELINYLTLAFSYKEPIDENSKESWGKIKIPRIPQLLNELGIYRLDDKKIDETDCVISLAGTLTVCPDPEKSQARVTYLDNVSPLIQTRRSYVRLA